MVAIGSHDTDINADTGASRHCSSDNSRCYADYYRSIEQYEQHSQCLRKHNL
jgi:hypothetical protein